MPSMTAHVHGPNVSMSSSRELVDPNIDVCRALLVETFIQVISTVFGRAFSSLPSGLRATLTQSVP